MPLIVLMCTTKLQYGLMSYREVPLKGVTWEEISLVKIDELGDPPRLSWSRATAFIAKRGLVI